MIIKGHDTDKLEIGHDYGAIFGLKKENGQKLIYNGGISWTGIQGDQEKTMDSEDTTLKVLAYSAALSSMPSR